MGLRILFVVFVSWLLGACTTTPTGRSQLNLVSDGKMNAMGEQAFGELKRKTPIERDRKTNLYVRCVVDNLLKMTSDTTGVGDWEVVVFKDSSANAFALPGGKIGVHTGILKVAKTQHQLAAVLGHEVGHVIARHGAERMSQALMAQGGLAVAGVMTEDNKNRGAIMAALGLGAQFGVLLPFGRKQESEGDAIGLDLMSKAGFDPRGSVELWQNMKKAGGGSAPEFLSTHPGHSTRIKNLNRKMNGALEKYHQAQSQGRNPNCKN